MSIDPGSMSTASAAGQLRSIAASIANAQALVTSRAAGIRTARGAQESAARAANAQAVINSAGQATSQHTITGKGIGTLSVTDPIVFTVPFRQQPHFTQATGVISKLPSAQDPRGQVSVRRWIQDDKGNFTGANITLWIGPDTALVKTKKVRQPDGTFKDVVEDGTTALDQAEYVMQFYLTFTGLAYKALTDDVMTKMDDVTVKSTIIGNGI
jgi:hypothetical protein